MPEKEYFGNADQAESDVDAIVERIYGRLRKLAAKVRWSGPLATQPTSLLHDAYIRLKTESSGVSHQDSVAVFATVMRRILVDKARKYRAAKRGGGAVFPLTTDDVADPKQSFVIDILDLDNALAALEQFHARQARVVECRFMLGCTSPETAKLLGLSPATVDRDWVEAKAFLSRRMNPGVKSHAGHESGF